MPRKPAWYRDIPALIEHLESHSQPYIDRHEIETLLGVGRRRAQQIMAPCVARRFGSSGAADRSALVTHLRRLLEGTEALYEIRRRRKVAAVIESLRSERLNNPALLVEAPVEAMTRRLRDLPAGVRLDRGRITVEFATTSEALEKLLALAVAISNDFERFDRLSSSGPSFT